MLLKNQYQFGATEIADTILKDGWILAKFFVAVHKKVEKERGQYPAILTEPAWSIKDLLYGQKITPKTSLLREQMGNRERTRPAHLVHSGSQSEHWIRFILPARGASPISKGYF